MIASARHGAPRCVRRNCHDNKTSVSYSSNPSEPRRPRRCGRPKHEAAIELREQFLTDAFELFVREGFAGTSIDAIARHAKVSRNTIYLQFTNKERLFEKAAVAALHRFREPLRVDLDDEEDLRRGVLAIVARIQVALDDDRTRALARLLIAEAQRFPALSEALLAELRSLLDPFTRYLERWVVRGALRAADCRRAAQDLTLLAVGGFEFFLGSRPSSKQALRDERERVVQLLLDGWIVRGER